jgi:signal transduction histidine kinase
VRSRILRSTLLVVLATAVLLGVPLVFTTWKLVEDITRTDLAARLDRVSADVVVQEGEDGQLAGPLDTDRLRLAVPADGRLVVRYPDGQGSTATSVIGRADIGPAISESLDLGRGGVLLLQVPSAQVRTTQLQSTAVVALVVLLSVVGGAVVSGLTARRLAGPLQDLASRAARLGSGDFRPAPLRYGVVELDRVSDVLDSSAVELAALLQRERELVGDVSHQLRSRLTAVRLRLDELAEHPDPAVVEEAGAAMSQVDRLTAAVDEMVLASRTVRTAGADPLDVGAELGALVAEWQVLYAQAGRSLQLDAEPGVLARATPSRLREAVVVLVENALVHGGGPVTVTVTRALVRASSTSAGREPTVLVEVGDSGPGVPEELVAHVFERGFSGAESSGVGLALARALVETDGGRLEMRRARPALFTIFLAAAGDGPSVPAVPGAREPR